MALAIVNYRSNKGILFFLRLIFIFISSHSFAAPEQPCYSTNPTGLKDFKPSLITFIADETEEPMATTLPDVWDWRNVQEQNWLTPVTSQVGCGDCVMHAMASAFESQFKIHFGLSWIVPRISISEGFYCGGGHCTQGWIPEAAIEYGKKVGFVDQSCGEQIETSDTCSTKICSDSPQRRWKIADYKVVTDGTLDITKIRQALLHGPVLTVMGIYDDFYCYKWGVYRHLSTTPPKVGHMLAIVGYNKNKKAWIVKNSWGSHWAENGYGYIYEKDTSGFGQKTWSLFLPSPEGFVDIENVQDHDVLKNKKKLILYSNKNQVESLYVSLTKNSQLIKEEQCLGPKCEIILDTKLIDDGDYEIQSYTAEKRSQSLVKKIQILNKEPLLALKQNFKIQPANILNGFKFSLKNTLSPSKLEARIVTKNKKVLYRQITKDITKNMTLILDSNLIKEKNLSLELWISYGDFPLRLLSKNKISN